ncbi:ATP-dependent DNA helicase chl1 [Dimargaris verticillata]|uniref:ATP-dependent DNA helicase CHL1 n=1 Tax=Dimargaris verticillata TaxID=2761393 RepID=A0A9W8B2V7_9FUNG|nr:ATP-dependent DNA helicase chl1 [Dimargaris verticillata]
MADPLEPSDEQQLPVPTGPNPFRFPFSPYPIQDDFMRHLFKAIEARKVGIFESPTGTGKTLSLLCGTLRWLDDHSHRLYLTRDAHQKQLQPTTECDEPDWVIAQTLEQKIRDQEDRVRRAEQRQARRREALQHWEARQRGKRRRVHTQTAPRDGLATAQNPTLPETDNLLPEPYYSDPDEGVQVIGDDGYSTTVRQLLEQLGDLRSSTPAPNPDDTSNTDSDLEPTKVYIASRTHSQLAQLVREIRKTDYAASARVIPLGSRKSLCINERVQRLNPIQHVNDACLDCQKKTTPAHRRCPYFPTDPSQLTQFQDHALAEVHDIEDLVTLGKQLKVCPYYGARAAIHDSQIVTLPYNMLLQKSAREALSIDVKDQVIIIDEAHNLVDTITQVHSAAVELDQVNRAHSQLSSYLQRYKARLKGSNTVYIRQILQLLTGLRKYLNSGGRNKITLPTSPDPMQMEALDQTHLFKPNELLHELGMDHINLYKIQRYMRESQIAKKLNGFIEQQDQQRARAALGTGSPATPSPKLPPDHTALPRAADETSWTSSRSALPLIETFLMALTRADHDGRAILGLSAPRPNALPQPYLKYLLLNPADSFRDIVDSARSVILAGGTMEPVQELTRLLFGYLDPARLHRFSCGHVIPPSSLQVLAVTRGPSNRPFHFVAETRKEDKLCDELGQALLNLCRVVPGGMVCFFPSYAYLDRVHAYWERRGWLAKLAHHKPVFCEPRASNQVEAILDQYRAAITTSAPLPPHSHDGALLLSVVGGKMSEGINFSDDMGRAVVMVGLPFANLGSQELQEKIRFVCETHRAAEALDSPATSAHDSSASVVKAQPLSMTQLLRSEQGREYYENLCMKAVNQSIGRAIRHQRDYATIILLDQRFASSRIHTKLPQWIGTRQEVCPSFGPVIAKVAQFFRQIRTETSNTNSVKLLPPP